jgi:hypothetical protein
VVFILGELSDINTSGVLFNTVVFAGMGEKGGEERMKSGWGKSGKIPEVRRTRRGTDEKGEERRFERRERQRQRVEKQR